MLLEKEIKGSEVHCKFESSNIKSSVYDYKTKNLDIEFNSGIKYRYFNVNEEVFTEFKLAESQGKVFHKLIKPHKFIKLLDDDDKKN